MLSFAVFDAGGPARGWPLHHAYLFGPDAVPIQAQISFQEGLIVCGESPLDATGLALQYDMERCAEEYAPKDLGVIMLRTCLLPAREQPYLLSLELARHRIMSFLNKLEDWGLFDLPQEDAIMRQFEDARTSFTAALVAQRQNPGPTGFNLEADKLARRALGIAIDAGEKLALLDADRDLPDRIEGRIYLHAANQYRSVHGEEPPADVPILTPDVTGIVLPTAPKVGCAVNPERTDQALHDAVEQSCDFITMPMRWLTMEPTEGRYAFARTDKWIEWAVRKAKIEVHAGPLVDFRPSSVPDWLYIWENDYETLRDLVADHVKHIVTRYRRTVTRWTVASGLHVNKNFSLTLEQMMDLTRIAVLIVRRLHPTGKVVLELDLPWGEYHAENRRSVPPALYAEMLPQAGVAVDSIGLRVQTGRHEIGQTAKDLMSFSSILDRYAMLERPIAITALGCPSEPLAPEPPSRIGTVEDDTTLADDDDTRAPFMPDVGDPGYWHKPWSNDVQAEWLTQSLAVALSKPYVQSVCWQDLYDDRKLGEMPHGGLLNADLEPKPALARLAAIRDALRERRSPLATAT